MFMKFNSAPEKTEFDGCALFKISDLNLKPLSASLVVSKENRSHTGEYAAAATTDRAPKSCHER